MGFTFPPQMKAAMRGLSPDTGPSLLPSATMIPWTVSPARRLSSRLFSLPLHMTPHPFLTIRSQRWVQSWTHEPTSPFAFAVPKVRNTPTSLFAWAWPCSGREGPEGSVSVGGHAPCAFDTKGGWRGGTPRDTVGRTRATFGVPSSGTSRGRRSPSAGPWRGSWIQ